MSADLTYRAASRYARPGARRVRRRVDAPARPVRQRPLTILIVDDVSDTRRMYAGYFEFVGASVLMAADGVEGLQSIYHNRPDVVLLDLAMPRMTGFEVLESVRRDARMRDLPIIALTGQISPASRESALRAGADLYLTKPCLPHSVFSSIVELMRRGSPAGGAPTA